MQSLWALISGLIFGLGLVISGMANPLKVQNFLDLFGTWDPSLAFVMGGAIAVTATGYRFVLKRKYPLLHNTFHLPTKRDLDPRLLSGAAIFGVGWGLSGFCPGPAITSASMFGAGTLIFVAAMIVGMWGAKLVSQASSPAVPAE